VKKKCVCLLSIALVACALVSCSRQGSSPAHQPSPPAEQPLASPTSSITDTVTSLAKGFVDMLVKGDYATAEQSFDQTMKAAMPAEKLQHTWESIIAQVGPFKRQVGTRTEKATQQGQQYDVVFVTTEFEKAMLDIRVVFNSTQQIAGLFFAPAQSGTPTPSAASTVPLSVREKEVVVGSGEWALPGTLTMPTGSGPFPAVVLVHGSGPNDRDETIGPNKPFRDLAWGLASRGVAVLRYDKRTKVYAAKMAPLAGSLTVKEEVIDDALAAVSLLRQTDGIRPDEVFVLGHSLGGMLVPRIGQQDPNIAGFIVMAGPTRPMEDSILEQIIYIASLSGTLTEDQKAQMEDLKQQVARVKDPNLSNAVPPSELPLGVSAAYWLDLRGYRPAEVAKSLPQPMLILQGERDYQVTTADFDGWKSVLSDRAGVHFKLYPKLNHLFMEGEGKSRPEEYNVAGHVAEYVIDDIASWVKAAVQ